jgi:DNA polymerase-4/DNA polymerase V
MEDFSTEQEESFREKVILHMDGDAFFVAVEVAKDPSLKGLPVVTGGERGIASAFSYEAKALGITRAMQIQRIKKEFPQVIVLNGDYKAYSKYSKAMFDIVRRYADDVEEYSIDECFADLTGLDKPLKMTYLEIAERIKKEVNEELGLSVTIGMAPTKVLAKVASKWVKPNGLTVITKEKIGGFLSKFPIEKIWGIGPRTSEALKKRGVVTAEDFISKDERWILANFSANYADIWRELRGVSAMKVNQETKTTYASIQRMHTFFPATGDVNFLLTQLSRHTEDVCSQARKYSLVPKKFTIALRDQRLRYTVLPVTLPEPTNAPEVILGLLHAKFNELYKKGMLYRATGITLQNLTSGIVHQATLFDMADTKADKFEEIHKQLDALEHKIGKRVVHLASTQKALKNMTEEISPDEEERNLLFI